MDGVGIGHCRFTIPFVLGAAHQGVEHAGQSCGHLAVMDVRMPSSHACCHEAMNVCPVPDAGHTCVGVSTWGLSARH